MESYIIRIYRRRKNNPHNIEGIVEEVGVEGKLGFTNLDELAAILNNACPAQPHGTKKKNQNGQNGQNRRGV